MSEPIFPGLPDALERMMASAEVAARGGLTRLAEFIEADAKVRVGEGGAHQYGTKTPARPGAGPAVISGDLRRSVTHTPIEGTGETLSTRVGPADIPHRTPHSAVTRRRSRGSSGSTATCGEIGLYVEQMGYPWLTPAVDAGVAASAELFGTSLDLVDW